MSIVLQVEEGPCQNHRSGFRRLRRPELLIIYISQQFVAPSLSKVRKVPSLSPFSVSLVLCACSEFLPFAVQSIYCPRHSEVLVDMYEEEGRYAIWSISSHCGFSPWCSSRNNS